MPDSFISPFSQTQVDPGSNLESRIQALEQWMRRSQATEVSFGSLDEAAIDLGTYQVGELIAGTGTPEGGDLSGVAIIYPGVEINGEIFNIVGMNNGNFEFGISAVDGTAVFAGGAGAVGANGIIMSGLFYPISFVASNAGNTRTGRFGMTLPTGGTVPVSQWDFESAPGSTVVLNGTFAGGALTSWTDASGAWSAVSDGAGGFCAEHTFAAAGWPAELTQVIGSITPSVNYTLAFDCRQITGYLLPKIYIDWRTSGHAVIRTDVVAGTNGGAWSSFSQTLLPPATTAEVNIRLNAGGDPFQRSDFRNISLALSGTVTQVSLSDGGMSLSQFSGVPAAPPPGTLSVYPKTDGFLYTQNPAGLEIKLQGVVTSGGVGIAQKDRIFSGTGANVSTYSQVVNVPTGLTHSCILIVGAVQNNTGSPVFSVNTFGGTAMTAILSAVDNATLLTFSFYLVNPTPGNNTVQFTWTGGVGHINCECYTLSSVNQSTPIGAGKSSNTTLSVSGIGCNLTDVIFDVITQQFTSALFTGPGAGQTVQYNDFESVPQVYGIATSSKTPASVSETMSWGAPSPRRHIILPVQLG